MRPGHPEDCACMPYPSATTTRHQRVLDAGGWREWPGRVRLSGGRFGVTHAARAERTLCALPTLLDSGPHPSLIHRPACSEVTCRTCLEAARRGLVPSERTPRRLAAVLVPERVEVNEWARRLAAARTGGLLEVARALRALGAHGPGQPSVEPLVAHLFPPQPSVAVPLALAEPTPERVRDALATLGALDAGGALSLLALVEALFVPATLEENP